jgi:acetyl-CoA carboxylase carboxyltransferase component
VTRSRRPPLPEAGELIPESSTGSYDVRHVAEAIVDDGLAARSAARWAANVVTAFATIGGRPVGIVANQPMNLAGTLDIPASQKAAASSRSATRSTCRSSPWSTRPASIRARTSSGAA